MSRLTFATSAAVITLVLAPAAQQVTQGPPIETRQQPALTFRATTNIVEVDAIVTDATGGFVRGLERGDFEVVEDGKVQTLSLSSLVDIPVERPDPPLFRGRRVIEPDVISNEKPFDGRVFVLFLDSFHVATQRSAIVKKHAREFVEKFLGANDIACVVQTGSGPAGQEFTSNKRLLLESIDKFVGQALSSATDNIVRDAKIRQDQVSARFPDPGPPEDYDRRERAFMARESADSLRRVSMYLTGLAGRRKALLMFSEGIDYSIQDIPVLASADVETARPLDDAASVRYSQNDVIAAASRANVSIYAIDPRGATTGLEGAGMAPGPPAPKQPDQIGRDYGFTDLMGDNLAEQRIAKDSLQRFADETGGIFFVAENDPNAIFRKVLDDNSAYYLLGFTSPDRRRDGRFHRVEVRVKRPGLKVRTRRGYYAPNEKEIVKAQVDPVRELLASPAPITGLRMRANAGIVRGPEGQARVHLTVEFNGADVTLKNQAGLFINDVEIGVEVLDMMGKPAVSARQFMHLRLRQATYEAFAQTGVRYVTEFDVPAGRYQLRIAAREDASGKTGSVFDDLEVPAFALMPLSMSDLLITSSSAEKMPTGKGAPSLGSKLPSQTTAARTFAAADTMTVFAGVYDTDKRAHGLDFKVAVTADDGREVFRRDDARHSDEVASNQGEFPYTLSVPLRALSPGRYVLTVEAVSRLGGEPARKDVEFRIR